MESVSCSTGSASELRAEAPGEFDDDDISLTSTVYEQGDEDAEYEVENILADMVDDDGKALYLVEWKNYPLGMCTWEPEEHLGAQLLELMWEDKKRQQDYQPFDLQLYFDAPLRRQERHRRRNEKRRRLGLPLTDPVDNFIGESSLPTSAENAPVGVASTSVSSKEESGERLKKHTLEQLPESLLISDGIVLQTSQVRNSPCEIDSDTTIDEPYSVAVKKKTKKAVGNSIAAEIVSGLSSSSQIRHPPQGQLAQPDPTGRTIAQTPTGKATKQSASALEVPTRPKRNISHRKVKGDAESVGDNPSPTTRTPSTIQDLQEAPQNATSQVGPMRKSEDGMPAFTKRLVNRRSGIGRQEASAENAFAGGKMTKQRTSLATAISDPARKQTLFTNHRLRRLAELRDREKPDRAIEASMLSTKLFPITRGPPIASAPSAGLKVNAREPPGPLVDKLSTSMAPQQTRGDNDMAVSRGFKKTKTVRFSTESDSDSPAVDATTMNDTAGDQAVRIKTRSVTKRLVFGSRNDPVTTSFDNVPVDDTSPLLKRFLVSETCTFRDICLAETFLQKFELLRNQNEMFHGRVSGKQDEGVLIQLENVAERLKAMTSGLFFTHNMLGVILFPAKCSEWKSDTFAYNLKSDFVEDGVNDTALHYLAFDTSLDCRLFLQPRGILNGLRPTAFEGISDRELLMQTFFHLDRSSYLQLFTERAHQNDNLIRNVFLVFPRSQHEAMKQMALWLQAVDPRCNVFFSFHAGAWSCFLERILARPNAGAVIVHELAIAAVHRFPRLHDLSSSTDCSFWSVSQSIHGKSNRLPPDFQLLNVAESTTLGGVIWNSILPSGLAILVTPSFIVSEPYQAYHLFDWFLRVRRSSAALIALVTSSNIGKLLKELADETALQHKRFQANGDCEKETRVESDSKAAPMGISLSECKVRVAAWRLVTQHLDFCNEAELSLLGEGASSFVYADQCIDDNDEQSLVNWFGWWSAIHLDKFRSFHVVGSSASAKKQRSERFKRSIQIPRFSPEAAAEPINNGECTNKTAGIIADPDQSGAAAQDVAKAGIVTGKRRTFPDTLSKTLKEYLMRCSDSGGIWKCYDFAIYWLDNEEASRYGVMETYKATIDDWFSFTWSFVDPSKGFFRAYIGFFYTIDEAGAMDSANEGESDPRHPWVAIYRPVDPHRKPFKKTELVIWDLRARDKVQSAMFLRESDLTNSQRAVIQHVRKHGPVKNKGLELDRVWIGGQHCTSEYMTNQTPSPRLPRTGILSSSPKLPNNELGITLDYLDSLVSSFRSVLPPKNHQLLKNGFKPVLKDENTGQCHKGAKGQECHREPVSSTSKAVADTDQSDEYGSGLNVSNTVEPGDHVKIIFRAPRRCLSALHHGHGPTKCGNRFFDSVCQARLRNARAKIMEYEYPPTLDWYKEQVEEGRGFEHIQVRSWGNFFVQFKIGDQQSKVKPSAS